VYADLATIFEQIQPPTLSSVVGADFCALPVPGLEHHRVAKDARAAPAILISVSDASRDVHLAPIMLENLTVQHDVDCRITRPGGIAEEARFTVVCYTGSDPTLQAYFLRIAAMMLQVLGATPSRLSVSKAVTKLAELFHALKEPPRKSLQGLWSELFLIAQSSDPVMLAGAWHIAPHDLYDFSFGAQRIEVKSARGRARRHYFTLEQLQPPPGAQLQIASILVEACETGTSLLDLLDQIGSQLGSRLDLALRVESVVGLTLGDSWRRSRAERFDRSLAEESLAFYYPENIPKVSSDIPSGVSEVRFRSDLVGLHPTDTASLRYAQGLFRAALRR
jgi:Putative  PD-(D/E)XK family member, (DUF4420)